jgi:hypothetical protein
MDFDEHKGDEEFQHQQVMGPDASLATETIVPKFKCDGGNLTTFNRLFITRVAKAYGVAEVYNWAEDKELTPEEEQKDNTVFLLLRQYLTERVLKIVMVGNPERASTIYKVLKTVFLSTDARTSLQVDRELSMCEMTLGESLQDFIARLNDLMEESCQMGEPMTDRRRMITLATRLRDP